ncbi:MAG: quinonprotein alcohol dehydrogenase [Candidatus Eremiobacter antarcticus]|nr:PQQ-dependent dehydrogenase, methanol/ethanol family [Candidatus Eremiobacteraeota bacterium]MBC5809043.1 PQQ-dependent dehydrogenase, methanol/ethanol family [Candidatus Eremiobacteraeota bacterium]PZR64276.1 MAG: quinonprotein alcohol dehydrogenase [Candidatus Eremiobacter sp. RRmetagenome_bin22]
MRSCLIAMLSLALVFGLWSSVGASPSPYMVSAADLMHADVDSGQWLMYGHDYSNQRYSKLRQINTNNVTKMQPAWVFQTGVIGPFETTPVVVGDRMYITTANSHVFALDARNGVMKWHYQPKLAQTIFCCGNVNRGVAVAEGKVFVAQLDGKLVALDQDSGKMTWQVQVGDNTAGYSLTMAPLVYKDMVLVGGAGGEYGVRGSVSAYSRSDGALRWRFYTVGPGWEGDWSAQTPNGADLHRNIAAEKAVQAKYADSWKTGGGASWMTPAIDTQMNTIFVTTGNPSPDLDGSGRPGDNQWSDSVIALDADTGKMKWAYQEIPHDVWDLDAVSPAVLFTTTVNGQKVPAVGQAGKTAWFYVLDRRTGKQIRVSEAFDPQENMFAQPTGAGTRMLPGANGGDEWSPVSFDPSLGYAFIVTLNQPMLYKTRPAPLQPGALWLGSAFLGIPTEKQDGSVVAIDTTTGKIAWRHMVDYPMIGGAASTGGNLTFVGESNGNFDAFNSKTGRLLWHFQTGAGVNAAPMVYEIGGQEYVAVASGGSFQINSPYGDALYVFHVAR